MNQERHHGGSDPNRLGFDPNKILGGPNWLEMYRFDVIAKVPAQKLMLQGLLQERFKLALRKDTKGAPRDS